MPRRHEVPEELENIPGEGLSAMAHGGSSYDEDDGCWQP